MKMFIFLYSKKLLEPHFRVHFGTPPQGSIFEALGGSFWVSVFYLFSDFVFDGFLCAFGSLWGSIWAQFGICFAHFGDISEKVALFKEDDGITILVYFRGPGPPKSIPGPPKSA